MSVIRRLLALLCFLVAWTTLAQIVERSPPTAKAASTTEAAAPQRTGDQDSRWTPDHRVVGSLSGPHWKSSVVHAALAAARATHTFAESSGTKSPARPAPRSAVYLRDIPLLI